ncbi:MULTISPECIES: hypothetical protein [Moorena]|nr:MULTISPECIES: hypothetical protein [Moorena]
MSYTEFFADSLSSAPYSLFPTPDSPYPKTKVPQPIDNWYS